MEIDPKKLPEKIEQCHAMMAEMARELGAKDRRLKRVLHFLEKLLRWRYGPKRERVYENQLFLFAAGMVATDKHIQAGPVEFLKEFMGYLQADAYSGYDVLYQDENRDVTEVACWAHTRRKFYDAQSSDLMRSMVMLAYPASAGLLYDVEREAKEMKLDAQGRLALRQAKSVPVLDDIKAYLQREQPNVLPKSPEGHAITYTLSNWEDLIRYCEDGDLELDNNGAERSLRGIAVGRKNPAMAGFFGSDNGGRTGAILTSFITTCKRLPMYPFTYLRDVFQRISPHPAKRLQDLLPNNW